MTRLSALLLSVLLLTCSIALNAARPTNTVEISVAPAARNWTTSAGEDAKFVITLTDSNIGIDGAEVEYEISEDLMTPRTKGSVTTRDGRAEINGGTMQQPGFLRCKVTYRREGKSYTAMGTIGFDPESIRPVTAFPTDFKEYWNAVMQHAARTPLNPVLTPLPDKGTDKVDVYQVRYSTGAGSAQFYGMLAVPKAPGKYAAIVQYPGAGVYAIDAPVSMAEEGFIAMAVGVHGIPYNLDNSVYDALGRGILAAYFQTGMHSRDSYYYRNVIIGAVRAIDFIATLPQFNGCVATYGGSQGGYLSIAVAALNPTVKFVVANFPAMSDLAGYAHGRAGGWPHIFKNPDNRSDLLLDNLSYYDTANFARLIKVPGFYAFGFNDLTCAPTTTYAVYNTIPAPKTLFTAPLAGHYLLEEQKAAELAALYAFLRQCGE